MTQPIIPQKFIFLAKYRSKLNAYHNYMASKDWSNGCLLMHYMTLASLKSDLYREHFERWLVAGGTVDLRELSRPFFNLFENELDWANAWEAMDSASANCRQQTMLLQASF